MVRPPPGSHASANAPLPGVVISAALRQISAWARLDEVEYRLAVLRERATGDDEDVAWLVNEAVQGRLHPLSIDVAVAVEADGHRLEIELESRDLWAAAGSRPFVERQVSDYVLGELPRLGRVLEAQGFSVTADELYVHVHLDGDMASLLSGRDGDG